MATDYIELVDTESHRNREPIRISKSSLYQQLKSNSSDIIVDQNSSQQLVLALGGMESILSHYLSPQNDINISQSQLEQIYAILSTDPKQDTLTQNHQVITFSRTDIIIYKLLNPVSAKKLINFLYHPITISIVVILLVIARIMNTFIVDPSSDNYFIYSIVACIWEFIFLVFTLLSLCTLNISALRLSATTFIFWFKILSCLKYNITTFILYYYLRILDELENLSPVFIGFRATLPAIYSVTVVIILCAYDALYAPRKMKIIGSVTGSIMWTIITLKLIFDPPTTDESIIKITDNISFSLNSIWEDSAKVMAIFFWKQTIFLIRNPNKCINIRFSPYFKWD